MTKTTKHKRKPGYKQTALGCIPEDWEVKKIAGFTKLTAGGTPSTTKTHFWDGSIRWMNSGELNLKKVFEVNGRITEEGLKNSSTKILPKNCVLIGLAGQGKTRGTVAINKVELCTNQSIAAILPNGSFDEEYLYYNLDARYEELRRLSTGDGGRGGLNLNILGGLHVLFPPLPEQKAIAAVLSTWDKAISNYQLVIINYQLRKKYLMQQLLTGKKRLKGFKGEWKETEIGRCFEFIKSYSISRDGLSKDYKIPSIYCIHYGDIHAFYETDFLDFSIQQNIPHLVTSQALDARDYLKEGDVIMADVSEDYEGVGESVVVVNLGDKIAVGGLHTIVLRSKNKMTNKFFNGYLFASEAVRNQLRKKATGTSVYSVSKPSLQTIPILLPSVNEQKAIGNILMKADQEIAILKQKLVALKKQKDGLMQVLLTGKRRMKI